MALLINLIGAQYLAQNPPSVGSNQSEWIDSELYFNYLLKWCEQNNWNVQKAIAKAVVDICNQVRAHCLTSTSRSHHARAPTHKNSKQQLARAYHLRIKLYPQNPTSVNSLNCIKRPIPDFLYTMVKALIRVRAHGVPFSLVAIVLTALIVALIVFYFLNDWTLFVVAGLLLMVLALSLRTILVVDSFKLGRHKSSLS